jgi:hypothetical protein
MLSGGQRDFRRELFIYFFGELGQETTWYRPEEQQASSERFVAKLRF